MKKHVFIIGSRGLPAKYGGFETFVEELVKHQNNKNIKYHVACQSENSDMALPGEHFEYLGADCFVIKLPKIGSARVIAYDILAINVALKYCKKKKSKRLFSIFLGIQQVDLLAIMLIKSINLVENYLSILMDWNGKRTKWAAPIRSYLKFAEKKWCDMLI